MKRLLLIYNPSSGDGRIKASLSDLTDFFTKQDFEVTVHPTQYPGDACRQIRRRAKNFDRVIACGGDGMIHEAVNGCMEQDSPVLLGCIPTGTVNDFANSHEIPFDIVKAAEIAAGDDWISLDVGSFNDSYFTYVAAFGVATAVSYQTPQDQKRLLGSLAYVLNALSTVDFAHWENNCVSMKIQWKGGQTEGDFLYGMVSNSRFVAGTTQLTGDLFNWRDGLLEGLFIRRPNNLGELNAILAGIARQDYSGSMFVRVQSPWFDFYSDETPWTVDGEFGGSVSRVHAAAVPLALNLLMSKKHMASQEMPEIALRAAALQNPALQDDSLQPEKEFLSLAPHAQNGQDHADNPDDRKMTDALASPDGDSQENSHE